LVAPTLILIDDSIQSRKARRQRRDLTLRMMEKLTAEMREVYHLSLIDHIDQAMKMCLEMFKGYAKSTLASLRKDGRRPAE
jgi:hypothetical protein